MGGENNPSQEEDELFDYDSEIAPIGRATTEGMIPELDELSTGLPLHDQIQNQPK